MSRMEVSLACVLYTKLELCKCVKVFIWEVTRGALIDCRCLVNQQKVTNKCEQGSLVNLINRSFKNHTCKDSSHRYKSILFYI